MATRPFAPSGSRSTLPLRSLVGIRVDCNGQEAFHRMSDCPALTNPPAAPLNIDLDGSIDKAAAGFFEIYPTVQIGIPTPELGATRSLCAVRVGFAAGDSDETVLERAAEAIHASGGCALAGVTAGVAGIAESGEDAEGPDAPFFEDNPVLRPELEVQAPGLTGSYLLPTFRTAPGGATGACFTVSRLGVPWLATLAILELDFSTAPAGSAGGEISILESSALGLCEIRLPTSPGRSATEIAQGLAERFAAPGAAGLNPDCKGAENPRDVSRRGSSLASVAARELRVCVDDPGVGIVLRPAEVRNLPPIAEAGNDRTVRRTDPAPADVASATSTDFNANGRPDECEIGRVVWRLSGVAEGGQVSLTIDAFFASCTVTVDTVAGQTAAEVTAALAAAVNADPCLQAQDITAAVSGGLLTVTGFLLAYDRVGETITDPGLRHDIPVVFIPALTPVGLVGMALLLLAAGLRSVRALRSTPKAHETSTLER